MCGFPNPIGGVLQGRLIQVCQRIAKMVAWLCALWQTANTMRKVSIHNRTIEFIQADVFTQVPF